MPRGRGGLPRRATARGKSRFTDGPHCHTSDVRIGTWNLEGRWSPEHDKLMAAQGCDVWLLTEVNDRVELAGLHAHLGQSYMAAQRRWAAIFTRRAFEPLADPHPASASVRLGSIALVSSVLPWRACGSRHPWGGGRHAERTQATVREIVQSTESPAVWGGDWNHALQGPEYAGSRAGRGWIVEAAHELRLQIPTAHLPHRINGLLSIDHIAVPAESVVLGAERVVAAADSKRLSDHDAYVVTIQD